jgi:hypothetical protein
MSNNDDTTPPESDFPPIFDPPEPDGENDWFISNVTVFLNASDDLSGVKEIRYTIDGGPEQVITGSSGSFVLTEEGDDILVEYWAIDNAGNVENPKNSFTIDIDKTPPLVKLSVKIIFDKGWNGWYILVHANATDAMSGMERIEFYYNDELQETVSGSGPEYVWTLKYWPLPINGISVGAFDFAGHCTKAYVNVNKLKITGPRIGRPGIEYEYTFKIRDSDEGEYLVYVDWGDGTHSGWVGPFTSEEPAMISHSWPNNGIFKINAKAMSVNGTDYLAGSFKTYIPREKIINNPKNFFINKYIFLEKIFNFVRLKLF